MYIRNQRKILNYKGYLFFYEFLFRFVIINCFKIKLKISQLTRAYCILNIHVLDQSSMIHYLEIFIIFTIII